MVSWRRQYKICTEQINLSSGRNERFQLGERVLLLEKASQSDSSRHNHWSEGTVEWGAAVPRVQFVVASWQSSKSGCRLQIRRGCSWTVGPARKRANAGQRRRRRRRRWVAAWHHTSTPVPLRRPSAINYSCGANQRKAQRGCVAAATSVPPCVPVSMLVSAKLSGYLLSLLLAPVLFLAGSESLSQSQILLLLGADGQTDTRQCETQGLIAGRSISACSLHFQVATQRDDTLFLTDNGWRWKHKPAFAIYIFLLAIMSN